MTGGTGPDATRDQGPPSGSPPSEWTRAVAHTGQQAVQALEQAAWQGRPVLLVSASDAAGYLGSGYFLAMIRRARHQVPGAVSIAVLDCGANPGYALAALDSGVQAVRLVAPSPVMAAVAAIARRRRALVFAVDWTCLTDPVMDRSQNN
jgi:hypothetical protein